MEEKRKYMKKNVKNLNLGHSGDDYASLSKTPPKIFASIVKHMWTL